MGRSATVDEVRDVRMANRLRHRIESDASLARLDVDVDVEDGVIELIGVIPDEREHDRLLALVESTAGSRGVVDHLILHGSDRRSNARVLDPAHEPVLHGRFHARKAHQRTRATETSAIRWAAPRPVR